MCYRAGMPKAGIRTPLCRFAMAVAAFLLAVPNLSAQTSPSPLPTNAKNLLRLAAQRNGLAGSDLAPWHLKVSYTLYDETGKASGQGSFEEFWASPAKFKRTIVQGDFKQTDFGTEHGILRSGSREQASRSVDQMREAITVPFPSAKAIEEHQFGIKEREVMGEKLSCLMAISCPSEFGQNHAEGEAQTQAAGGTPGQEGRKLPCQTFLNLPVNPGFYYCLAPGSAALRAYFSDKDSTEEYRAHLLNFQDRFVPGDLILKRAGKTVLTAHVDALDRLDPVRELDFAPTPDATAVHRRIAVSAGVAVGLLQEHAAPLYPIEAKKAGISGTVVMRAVIGVDGFISELTIVQGPPELQQAAMDAARRWRYRPYLLNGEPIEVLTQINVIFTLQK
jgi:TonB family protein